MVRFQLVSKNYATRTHQTSAGVGRKILSALEFILLAVSLQEFFLHKAKHQVGLTQLQDIFVLRELDSVAGYVYLKITQHPPPSEV